MKVSDFDYQLPPDLIASLPAAQRSGSRLLLLDRQRHCWEDRQFVEFADFLSKDDLLVFNNTRVIPARLHGVKDSGGQVEVLVERVLDQHRVLAHTRASKSPKPGRRLCLEQALNVEVLGRQGDLFELQFLHEEPVLDLLERYGHMPLPPYIERDDDAADRLRYQTVFAQKAGAVAAPTAGLHFDEAMLAVLKQKGIRTAEVTLHVGAGTFQPMRVERIEDHVMHSEYLQVDMSVCEAIRATRARGGKVVAVGTTVVRCLETASDASGEIHPFEGDTQIFIYPGYQFKQVDMLLTNFHLPQSSLLLLVSALAGKEFMLEAYQHAIEQRYRFFSYGDAMLIT